MELTRYRWTTGMVDIPFLLGAVAADRLCGPSLVTLLTGLGRSESAARNLITRMAGIGALRVERVGRVSVCALAPSSYDRYREVEGTSQKPSWSGTFDTVIYQVPERNRALRDRLLHTARSAGYGLLRAGILISATPRWDRLRLDPAEFTGASWVRRVEVTPASVAEAREMAERAWDLPHLASAYRHAIDRCTNARLDGPVDWSALALWRDVYTTCFNAQLRDPLLPTELLPTRWPAERFHAAQRAMNERIGRPLQPFLRARADERDTAGLNEYYTSPWAEV